MSRGFAYKEVEPRQIIDSVKTLDISKVITCDWLESDWLTAERLLEWSTAGLNQNDNRGLADAVTYAKRAVCRRLDSFLIYNHLRPFLRKVYPAKIEALRKIGISIPNIVQQLGIEPRNLLEHSYRQPTAEEAQKAVEIAQLFLPATKDEAERFGIVFCPNCLQLTIQDGRNGKQVTFNGFSSTAKAMLFVDAFENVPRARMIFPQDMEILQATLDSFTQDEAIQLAKLLRSHYSEPSRSRSNYQSWIVREIKQQGEV